MIFPQQFYIKDTKSSNGTYVNNQRLSKVGEESEKHQVFSGDILQFGVDVMENSRKFIHGSIIATLRLFCPDGTEAHGLGNTNTGMERGSAAPTAPPNTHGEGGGSLEDLQALREALGEARSREEAMTAKLQGLGVIMHQTQEAAKKSWRAMINEDRLLQKLEMMEDKLSVYAKNWPQEKLKNELCRLIEEKVFIFI